MQQQQQQHWRQHLLTGWCCVCACSFEEQLEVEEHFLDTKFLIPQCQKGYWLGYKATSWPNFQSLVRSAVRANPGMGRTGSHALLCQ